MYFEKLCPLRRCEVTESSFLPCLGGKCAWFHEDDGACAILLGADCLFGIFADGVKTQKVVTAVERKPWR